MELEDEASLDIVCADSEDNILLNKDGDSFGCLSEEEVEVFQPPRGRMIETKGSELVDSLRQIAKSSPQMADLLLQNSDVLDKRLHQIAQTSSMPSSYVDDSRDEIVQKSSVTVVDYPSNDRVEVFGPIDNDEAGRDAPDKSGEELCAPSPKLETANAQEGSIDVMPSPAGSVRSAQSPVAPSPATLPSGQVSSARPSNVRSSAVNTELSPRLSVQEATPQAERTPTAASPTSVKTNPELANSVSGQASPISVSSAPSNATSNLVANDHTHVRTNGAKSGRPLSPDVYGPPRKLDADAEVTKVAIDKLKEEAHEDSSLDWSQDAATNDEEDTEDDGSLDLGLSGPPRSISKQKEEESEEDSDVDSDVDEDSSEEPEDYIASPVSDTAEQDFDVVKEKTPSEPQLPIEPAGTNEPDAQVPDLEDVTLNDEQDPANWDQSKPSAKRNVLQRMFRAGKRTKTEEKVKSPSKFLSVVGRGLTPLKGRRSAQKREHDNEEQCIQEEDHVESGPVDEDDCLSDKEEEPNKAKGFLHVVGRSMTPLKIRLTTRNGKSQPEPSNEVESNRSALGGGESESNFVNESTVEEHVNEEVKSPEPVESGLVDEDDYLCDEKPKKAEGFMSVVSRSMTPLKIRLSTRNGAKSQPERDHPSIEVESNRIAFEGGESESNFVHERIVEHIDEEVVSPEPDKSTVSQPELEHDSNKQRRGMISFVGVKLPRKKRQKATKSQQEDNIETVEVGGVTSSIENQSIPEDSVVASDDEVSPETEEKGQQHENEVKNSTAKPFIDLLGNGVVPNEDTEDKSKSLLELAVRAFSPTKCRPMEESNKALSGDVDSTLLSVGSREIEATVANQWVKLDDLMSSANADQNEEHQHQTDQNDKTDKALHPRLFMRAVRALSPPKMRKQKNAVQRTTTSLDGVDSALVSVSSREIEAGVVNERTGNNLGANSMNIEHNSGIQSGPLKQQEAVGHSQKFFRAVGRAISPVRRAPKEDIKRTSTVEPEQVSAVTANIDHARSQGEESPIVVIDSGEDPSVQIALSVDNDMEQRDTIPEVKCAEASHEHTPTVFDSIANSFSLMMTAFQPVELKDSDQNVAEDTKIHLQPVQEETEDASEEDFVEELPLSTNSAKVADEESAENTDSCKAMQPEKDVPDDQPGKTRKNRGFPSFGKKRATEKAGGHVKDEHKTLMCPPNGEVVVEDCPPVQDKNKSFHSFFSSRNRKATKSSRSVSNEEEKAESAVDLIPGTDKSEPEPSVLEIPQNDEEGELATTGQPTPDQPIQPKIALHASEIEDEAKPTTLKSRLFSRARKDVKPDEPCATSCTVAEPVALLLRVPQQNEEGETDITGQLSPDQSIQRKVDVHVLETEVEAKPTSPKSTFFFRTRKHVKPDQPSTVAMSAAPQVLEHNKKGEPATTGQLSADKSTLRKVDVDVHETEGELKQTSLKSRFFSRTRKHNSTHSEVHPESNFQALQQSTEADVAMTDMTPNSDVPLTEDKQSITGPTSIANRDAVDTKSSSKRKERSARNHQKVNIHAANSEIEAKLPSPKVGFFNRLTKSRQEGNGEPSHTQPSIENEHEPVVSEAIIDDTSPEEQDVSEAIDRHHVSAKAESSEIQHVVEKGSEKENSQSDVTKFDSGGRGLFGFGTGVFGGWKKTANNDSPEFGTSLKEPTNDDQQANEDDPEEFNADKLNIDADGQKDTSTVNNAPLSKGEGHQNNGPSLPGVDVVPGSLQSPKVEITESEYERSALASKSPLGKLFLRRSLSPRKARNGVTPSGESCPENAEQQKETALPTKKTEASETNPWGIAIRMVDENEDEVNAPDTTMVGDIADGADAPGEEHDGQMSGVSGEKSISHWASPFGQNKQTDEHKSNKTSDTPEPVETKDEEIHQSSLDQSTQASTVNSKSKRAMAKRLRTKPTRRSKSKSKASEKTEERPNLMSDPRQSEKTEECPNLMPEPRQVETTQISSEEHQETEKEGIVTEKQPSSDHEYVAHGIHGDVKVKSGRTEGTIKTSSTSQTAKAGKLLSSKKEKRSRKAIKREPLSPRNVDTFDSKKPENPEEAKPQLPQSDGNEQNQVGVHAVSADSFSTGLTPKHTGQEEARVHATKERKLAERRKKRIAKLVGDDDSTTGLSINPRTRSGHWWRRGPAHSGISVESPANASTSTKEFDKHMRVCAVSDEDVVEAAEQKEKTVVSEPYRRLGRQPLPVSHRPPLPDRLPTQSKQEDRKTADEISKPSRREKLAMSKKKLNRADDDVSAADETFNDNLSDAFAPPEVSRGGWMW